MFLKKSRTVIFSLMVVLLLVTGGQALAQAPDSKGTDFWLTFPVNHSSRTTTISLFITGGVNTSGTITIPGQGFSESFSVTPGQITTKKIPIANGQLSTLAEATENKGIHVQSQAEVIVYGLSQQQYTTDAYLGLPTDVLGTEYIIMSYRNPSVDADSNSTQFAIVSTQDNTTITIVPSVTTQGHTAGVAYTITLNQGQTYQLRNGTSATADLTGTIITSDKPISVFGSHRCATVPYDKLACDYLIEQMPPTSTWGQAFVTMPLARRLGDTFRILASRDNTNVQINGSSAATLNRGQFYEKIINGSAQITANQPILVAQYSNGANYDQVKDSDPFMMLIPSYEQFLGSYTVSTPDSGFASNYINIVAPSAAVGNIVLDGSTIAGSNFSPIGSSGFSGAQIKVTLGTHNLSSDFPFGAFSYGYNTYDSYGYPGGASFAPIARATSLVLTPETATGPINSEHCVTATVADQNSSPLNGIRVDFTVSGVHTNRGFAFTNADGKAQYCYTGTNPGNDTITASIGGLSDTATMVWVVKGTVFDPVEPINPGETCTFTAIIYDDSGKPIPNQQVVYTITRPDGTTKTATTVSDANGRVVITDACSASLGQGKIEVCIDQNGNAIHDPGEPTTIINFTQITLLSFTAESSDDQVTLAWETASELDNEGFNLWRSSAVDGQFVKINSDLIQAQGNETTGASYSFVDSNVTSGITYYYKLEDVDFYGVSTLHDPIELDVVELFDEVGLGSK